MKVKREPYGAIQRLYESLKCPITDELMVDPVVSGCGHSFERNAIISWIEESPSKEEQKCPQCGALISIKSLHRSYTLKAVLQEFSNLYIAERQELKCDNQQQMKAVLGEHEQCKQEEEKQSRDIDEEYKQIQYQPAVPEPAAVAAVLESPANVELSQLGFSAEQRPLSAIVAEFVGEEKKSSRVLDLSAREQIPKIPKSNALFNNPNVTKIVLWEVNTDLGWIPYAPDTQTKLEEAFQRNSGPVLFKQNKASYKVNLKDMQQVNQSTQFKRKVRRSVTNVNF